MEDRAHADKSAQTLLGHFHAAVNLDILKMDTIAVIKMNVQPMEEEDLVTRFVPILLVHSSAVVSLVTIRQAIVVLILMNVCKMEEWGLVHRIAPIQQDHFNAAASKVILCPDPTVLILMNATWELVDVHSCVQTALEALCVAATMVIS